MIDIRPESDDVREYEYDEPELDFYTHKDTGLIYEVQLFPEFAMVRVAVSDGQSRVDRMSLIKFADEFEEFQGDLGVLRSHLFKGTKSFIIVKKNIEDDE